MKENINPLRRTKMSKTMKSFGLALFFVALAGAPLLAQNAAGSAAKFSLFKLSLIPRPRILVKNPGSSLAKNSSVKMFRPRKTISELPSTRAVT